MALETDKNSSQRKITRAAIVLLIGFILGYVIPAAISLQKNAKAYTKDDVIKILAQNQSRYHDIDSIVLINYMVTDSAERNIENEIMHLKSKNIPDSVKTAMINQLKDKRDAMDDNTEIRIVGFTESRMSVIWPFVITGLLLIVFVILEVDSKWDNTGWFRFLGVFSIVTVIYLVLTYLRTANNKGRAIYSVYNLDINPYLYYYQIGLYMLFILLTTMIWTNQKGICGTKKESEFTFDGIFSALNDTKKCYHNWQLFSLILMLAFVPLLYVLYSNVFTYNDQRYLFQAVFFNIVYFITWLVGSVPLIAEFEDWKKFKNRILFDKSIEPTLKDNNINLDELKKLIPSYEIASSLNHAVTVSISSLSLFFPFLKPYIEKLFS